VETLNRSDGDGGLGTTWWEWTTRTETEPPDPKGRIFHPAVFEVDGPQEEPGPDYLLIILFVCLIFMFAFGMWVGYTLM